MSFLEKKIIFPSAAVPGINNDQSLKYSGALNEELLETSYSDLQNLRGLKGLVCHRITAFPGKLKSVPHLQEDGTDIFPSQLSNMSELCAFYRKHP